MARLLENNGKVSKSPRSAAVSVVQTPRVASPWTGRGPESVGDGVPVEDPFHGRAVTGDIRPRQGVSFGARAQGPSVTMTR